MSKALSMKFDSAIGGDLADGTSNLVVGDWLETVVFTSLFTDAHAADDEVPAGETERGGYWGDMFYEQSHGSLLWTLRREKLSQSTILRARDICLRALAWLVSAKHIRSVDVQTERLAPNRLGIVVQATRNNSNLETMQWEFSTDAA